ncbi:hypothetical protein AAZX31_03G210900 [Glycine max]
MCKSDVCFGRVRNSLFEGDLKQQRLIKPVQLCTKWYWEGGRELTMRLWLLSEIKSLLLRTSIASFPGNFNGDV